MTVRRPSLPFSTNEVRWVPNTAVNVYEDDGAYGDESIGRATVTNNGEVAEIEISDEVIEILLGEAWEGKCLEIDRYWTYEEEVEVGERRAATQGYVWVSWKEWVTKTVSAETYDLYP